MRRRWAVCGVFCWLSLALLLMAFLILPVAFAQEGEVSVAFSPQTEFAIPSLNGSISFAMGGSYTYASLENGTWNFAGLNLSGSGSAMPLPMVTGFNFSIYAQNSSVTVTRYTRLNVFPPQGSGELEYAVSGVGSQSFNVYYYYNQWLKYSVVMGGEAREENDGWTITDDGWITVTGATSTVKVTYGRRDPTPFTPADRFAIPALNSTVGFAFSGIYIYAEPQNDTWRFQNLQQGMSTEQSGFPRWALGVSARNCNVTLTNWGATEGNSSGWLNYTVIGVGTQIFNSDLDRISSWSLNYTVYVDGEEVPQNSTWTVSDDDWITVAAANANVSINYIQNIPDWFWNMPPPGPSVDKPSMSDWFIFILGAAVAGALVAAVVFGFRAKAQRKKQLSEV